MAIPEDRFFAILNYDKPMSTEQIARILKMNEMSVERQMKLLLDEKRVISYSSGHSQIWLKLRVKK